MSTRDALRRAGEPEKVTKTIAKKAIRSTMDNVCEECGGDVETGMWVLEVTEGTYVYYIHEVCP